MGSEIARRLEAADLEYDFPHELLGALSTRGLRELRRKIAERAALAVLDRFKEQEDQKQRQDRMRKLAQDGALAESLVSDLSRVTESRAAAMPYERARLDLMADSVAARM